MPGWLIPALISGASAIGGLLNNRARTSQTNQYNESGTQYGSSQGMDFGTLPIYRTDLADLIENLYKQQLDKDPDLTGYTSAGLQQINRTGDIRRKAMENLIASRGLSYSPAGTSSLVASENARLSDISNFLNQIPLLKRELQVGNINNLTNFFKALPIGEHRYGYTQSYGGQKTQQYGRGTQTTSGNPLGGLFEGGGSALALLYGLGAFGQKPRRSGP